MGRRSRRGTLRKRLTAQVFFRQTMVIVKLNLAALSSVKKDLNPGEMWERVLVQLEYSS